MEEVKIFISFNVSLSSQNVYYIEYVHKIILLFLNTPSGPFFVSEGK